MIPALGSGYICVYRGNNNYGQLEKASSEIRTKVFSFSQMNSLESTHRIYRILNAHVTAPQHGKPVTCVNYNTHHIVER